MAHHRQRLKKMGFGIRLHSSNPQPLMSASGQKQTSAHDPLMSALPPKADIRISSVTNRRSKSGSFATLAALRLLPTAVVLLQGVLASLTMSLKVAKSTAPTMMEPINNRLRFLTYLG